MADATAGIERGKEKGKKKKKEETKHVNLFFVHHNAVK